MLTRLDKIRSAAATAELDLEVAALGAEIARAKEHERANRESAAELEAMVYANRHWDPWACHIHVRRELRKALRR